MGKKINLTGQRFGRLLVIEEAPKIDGKSNYIHWKCCCDCGNIVVVSSSSLRSGNTKSCGCLKKDTVATLKKKHNGKHTLLYKRWKGIKQRCYDPNHKYYANYGGRGVIVCDEWKNDFSAFRSWALANGYQDNLSIDRIDNDKPYCPENCRWVTKKVQENNKRNNHLLEYNGEVRTLAEWADLLGTNRTTLSSRIKRGWTVERVLFEPVHK